MLSRVYLRVFSTAMAFVALSLTAVAAETIGISVWAPRPMAEAVIAMGEQTDHVITYEDPPFQYLDDLRPVLPGSESLVPKSGMITYDYERGMDAAQALRDLVARHAEEGNAGEFTVLRTGMIYNVIPGQYRDATGGLVAHESILDTRVSLSLTGRNCQFAFEALCLAVTESDPRYRLLPGRTPLNAFLEIPYDREVVDKSARDVLNEILLMHQSTLDLDVDDLITWQARFDPNIDKEGKYTYSLSFRKITRSCPDCMKLRVSDRRPMAAAVRVLERRFRAPISYEDPLYVCPSDLMGGTGLVGGIINMDWRQRAGLGEVLGSLVNKPIGPRANPDVFRVIEVDGRYHIVPDMVKDEQGYLAPQQPKTSTTVTVGGESVTGLAYLEKTLAGLSENSGESLALGSLAEDLSQKLHQVEISQAATDQEARLVLDSLLARFDDRLSWQLLFDPESRRYDLYIYQAY